MPIFYHVKEILVYPGIIGQFRMECKRENIALSRRHDEILEFCQYLNVIASRYDGRRADEYGIKRSAVHVRDLKLSFKRVFLSAERVTVHGRIH